MPKPPPTPSAADLLKAGSWSVDDVARILDAPAALVRRWCVLGLIRGARQVRGAWSIPGRGLVFFCAGRIEPRYSAETIAALLDVAPDTVRDWIKRGRLKKAKWGLAKSAPVRVTESELARFLKGGEA